MSNRKRIFKQLFDIRPTVKGGDLDMEKILEVKKVLDLKEKFRDSRDTKDYFALLNKKEAQKDWRDYKKDFVSQKQEPKKEISESLNRWEDEDFEESDTVGVSEAVIPETKPRKTLRDLTSSARKLFELSKTLSWLRPVKGFALAALILTMLIAGGIFAVGHFSQSKEKITIAGTRAIQHLHQAQLAAKQMDFTKSSSEFDLAYRQFRKADQSLGSAEKLMISILGNFSGSSLAQGQTLLDLGKDLSLAGYNLTQGIKLLSEADILGEVSLLNTQKKSSHTSGKTKLSLAEAIIRCQELFKIAEAKISKAQLKLKKIDFQNLGEVRASIEGLSSQLPQIQQILARFLESEDLILEILGHQDSRKYLLLFQNNSEMRATGGFIGTYGILDLDDGKIKNIFIDGIYNPDGQLKVKVVPPKPIQKISAAWSMHDANWFADFPTSAKKVAWFYEKTGGPTVDGVIALTNEVLVRLLEITGPIEMPSYGVTINSNNFTEKTQYQVEIDYDKEENKPKQFIADLAPKILEKAFGSSNSQWFKVLDVLSENLKEKHILLFFFDEELEEKIRKLGWAGEVKEASRDYLSIINSNINGYKTDAVIAQRVRHLAEIQKDGSIIDTLTITRQHLGGETHYDWWNKVNSDWLRVYVPKGSELLEAKGHTLEEPYEPSIDYSWFKLDPLVAKIEEGMIRDNTGTYIFEESEKTVFGNWVYVSPGEEVTITYKYKLPFKINTSKPADTYSLLVQKQSGTKGSKFNGKIKFPEEWEVIQSTSEGLGLKTDLSIDRFYGATFGF